MLGLLLKPVLALVGDIHGAEHQLTAQSELHHHTESVPHDDATGPGHTDGTHGLMHQAGCEGASTDGIATLALRTVAYQQVLAALPAAPPVILQHITGPFRPPIA
ncbi:MAG: hypothetical protein M3Q94_05850 [Pseudomonadota bacterium]|nr:hypothetical protein [Pseudomonadota bacterium]